MSKLFDNMAKLEFTKDDDDNDTKDALGMYSKEGEYVDFDETCECSGQVRIKITVRKIFEMAVHFSRDETWNKVMVINVALEKSKI